MPGYNAHFAGCREETHDWTVRKLADLRSGRTTPAEQTARLPHMLTPIADATREALRQFAAEQGVKPHT